MNSVQNIYTPPRVAALVLAVIVFTGYQLLWRPILLDTHNWGAPTALPLAVLFSAIVGYGLAMLRWLIMQTRGQFSATFRPTRGRLIGAVCLGMVMPLTVFSWMPWIVIGLLPIATIGTPVVSLLIIFIPIMAAYPIAAMIVRHTYERRWLRFGLFALTFWTAYAFIILWQGEQVFRI